MDHFDIWDVASMAWTEIGLGDSEYERKADELRARFSSWAYVDTIIVRDVCGAFASTCAMYPLVLVPIIGLFMITPMPDWGYEEAYLRRRMKRWESKPVWFHFLNPFRVLGYPLAFLFCFGLRRKLRRAFLRSPMVSGAT